MSPNEGYHALQPAGEESSDKAADGAEVADIVCEGSDIEEGVLKKPSCS